MKHVLVTSNAPKRLWIMEAALVAVLLALYLAAGNSIWYFLVAVLIMAVFPIFGKSATPLFMLGLNIADEMEPVPGIPVPRFIILLFVFAVSMSLYGAIMRTPVTLSLSTAVLTAGLGVYYLAVPPNGSSAMAAGYALVVLPLTLCLLSLALSVDTPDSRNRLINFVGGSAIGVGVGLFEAYSAVGGDYQAYSAARVFESAIGSSNKAAAISAAVGFLLVGMGMRYQLHRWPLRLIALPFLLAPIVFASRGPLVSAVLVLVAALFLGGSSVTARVMSILAGSAVIAVVVSGTITFNLLVLERFQQNDSSKFLSGRAEIWSYVWSRITERPILGWGPGGVTNDLLAAGMTAYPHQALLGLIVQVGFIGGLAYAWIIFQSFPARWSPLSACLLYLVIVSMVEPVISTPGAAPLFGCLLALSSRNERCSK